MAQVVMSTKAAPMGAQQARIGSSARAGSVTGEFSDDAVSKGGCRREGGVVHCTWSE